MKKNMTIIKIKKHKIELEWKHPKYPFGRCMNLGPGIRAMNKTLDLIVFQIISTNTPIDSNVRVLFKDPINGKDWIPTGFCPAPSMFLTQN